MLQTMPLDAVTLLQDKDEISSWDNRPFVGAWIETKNEKTVITRNRTIKKKCKRVRTAFTTDQLRTLEKTFLKTKYINSENRRALSNVLKIGEKCIKIWFQNRRMKEKRGSSESSDSSSEAFSGEASSPVLVVQPDPETLKYDQSNQFSTVYQAPCHFYPLTNFPANANLMGEAQSEVYEPNHVFIPNYVYGNGYNETSAFATQYSPSETDVNYTSDNMINNAYQNQYQYGYEVYNWCTNNTDSYNYYQ